MQAPHPPQKKTAQKNKVWAKETFLKKLGNQWIFVCGQSEWGEAARKIM
jgi:hypothetical protein